MLDEVENTYGHMVDVEGNKTLLIMNNPEGVTCAWQPFCIFCPPRDANRLMILLQSVFSST